MRQPFSVLKHKEIERIVLQYRNDRPVRCVATCHSDECSWVIYNSFLEMNSNQGHAFIARRRFS